MKDVNGIAGKFGTELLKYTEYRGHTSHTELLKHSELTKHTERSGHAPCVITQWLLFR